MITKMHSEGKSMKEIADRIKKFREHHGRMGGFTTNEHYFEKFKFNIL